MLLIVEERRVNLRKPMDLVFQQSDLCMFSMFIFISKVEILRILK